MAQSIQGQPPRCLGDRYTNVPNALHALADTPREFELMAALLSYRWRPDSPIIPSVDTLARQCGCSHRTIRRTAAALEARGLLRREARHAEDDRQMSNAYVLDGALLAAVTRMEAMHDRRDGQPWQGRRSALSGKPTERNYPNGTMKSQGWNDRPKSAPRDYLATRPASGRDFLETRRGRLEQARP